MVDTVYMTPQERIELLKIMKYMVESVSTYSNVTEEEKLIIKACNQFLEDIDEPLSILLKHLKSSGSLVFKEMVANYNQLREKSTEEVLQAVKEENQYTRDALLGIGSGLISQVIHSNHVDAALEHQQIDEFNTMMSNFDGFDSESL
jgi:hypothetical protein